MAVVITELPLRLSLPERQRTGENRLHHPPHSADEVLEAHRFLERLRPSLGLLANVSRDSLRDGARRQCIAAFPAAQNFSLGELHDGFLKLRFADRAIIGRLEKLLAGGPLDATDDADRSLPRERAVAEPGLE